MLSIATLLTATPVLVELREYRWSDAPAELVAAYEAGTPELLAALRERQPSGTARARLEPGGVPAPAVGDLAGTIDVDAQDGDYLVTLRLDRQSGSPLRLAPCETVRVSAIRGLVEGKPTLAVRTLRVDDGNCD